MEEQVGVLRGITSHAGTVLAACAAICCLLALSASSARAAAPANDNFAAAEVLTGQPVSTTGTTKQATRQSGEPNHAESDTGPSVWYRWTPSASGAATVDACDANEYVNAVAIYTGGTLGGLTEVASGYCQTVVQVTAGTEYRIAAASYSDWTGGFTLSLDVHAPPANDDFEDAEPITGSPVTGTTIGATRQAGEPAHSEYDPGMSVWYTWTPDESGTAVLESCDEESEDVTRIAAYTGETVDGLTTLDQGYCRAAFHVVAGTEYRVAVASSYWPVPFSMTVDVIPAPANDDFEDAAELTGTGIAGTTVGATRQVGEPEHGEEGTSATVWYRWTAPQSGTATFDTCDEEGNYYVEATAVYTGSTLEDLEQVDYGYCRVSVPVTSGTTYHLALASYSGWWGPFDLSVSVAVPPANDNFGSATPVTTLPATGIPGTTFGATVQAGEPDHDDSGATATVWYTLGPVQGATYWLNACDDDNYSVAAIAVYSGTSVDNLTRRASGGCQVLAKFAPNKIYRIAVASYPGDWGDFAIVVKRIPAPANDAFAAATAVNGDSVYKSGHTYSATREAGEPVHHPGTAGEGSVWYSWTPSSTGDADVEVCGEFDSVLAVYTGDTLANLQKVSSDDDTFGFYCDWDSSALEMRVTAGTTYKIAVDGKGENDQGEFDLIAEVYPDPVNHDLLVTRSGTGNGSVKANTDPATLDCGATCSYSYPQGSEISLIATPDAGSTFAGWAGACSGTGPCVITMSEARAVTATFDEIVVPPVQHGLTIVTTGTGSGSVSGVPGQSACRGNCSSTHEEGTRVTLTATPDSGSTFVGWSGACTGSAQCVVDLDSDRQVTASFEPEAVPPAAPLLELNLSTRKLTINAGKSGNVRLEFKNAGDLPASGLRLCLSVPAKFKKTVKPAKCVVRDSVKAHSATFLAMAVKTTGKAKGKFRLKASLTASNAAPKTGYVDVTVKPKKKKRR